MKRTIFCISVCLLGLSCKKEEEATFATRQDITQSVYASGVVKTRSQYQVFANSSGTIQKLLISEGEAVRQGQLIAQLSNDAVRLTRNNAALGAYYNDLRNNAERLDELSSNIELARQKRENDSILLARQQSLWQQNIGTKIELEQRELAAKNSKIAYNAAVLRYRQLKKQLDFAAKQAKVNLEISSAQTGELQVRSEINGQVFTLLKKQGEMVTPQTPIAVLGDISRHYLELQVDEYDIAQINVGQKIILTMDSYRGQTFEARVSKIFPIMNERSKTFTLEAEFVKSPEKLYPNLTAEANIIIQTKANALLIPRNYLIDNTYVMLKGGEKRKVAIGLKDYQKVEILSGLTPQDPLVLPKP